MRLQREWQNISRRIAVAVISITVLGYEKGAQGASEFSVMPRLHSVDPNASDKGDYVDVFHGTRLVKKIACNSDIEATRPCYPVKLSTGGFLVVDCYTHDAVGRVPRMVETFEGFPRGSIG